MKEREETFTELMQRAWITPKTYRNVLVSKIVGGYMVLNKKANNKDEVDKIIDDAMKSIENSIIN